MRADRPPLRGCDRVVVQNNISPDTASTRFIPHWPQPGLQPRDSQRGARLENIAYFGRIGGPVPWMTSESFRARLARLGVSFSISDQEWSDYRNLDAILSVRSESEAMLSSKPASKLTNAWLAGVPALLGNEPAFEALRHDSLDYVRVSSADEAIAAIDWLRNNPDHYQAMIVNGRARSRDFTRQAILERWLSLIEEVAGQEHMTASWSRFAGSLLLQKIDSYRWRRVHAHGVGERNAGLRQPG